MIDSTALARSFAENGYCVLPDFYSPQEVAAVDGFVTHWQDNWDQLKGAPSPEYRQRFDVYLKALPVSKTPEFVALFSMPKMARVTEAVVGEDFDRLNDFAFATPRDGGQGWHKDSCDPAPGQFTLNRLVYSRDYRPEQGKLYVLPGSHRYYGFKEDGPNHGDLAGQVEITPATGMLVLISSHCAHRVGINQTDDIRVVLNSRANPRGVPRDLCDLCTFQSGRWRHSTQTFMGR